MISLRSALAILAQNRPGAEVTVTGCSLVEGAHHHVRFEHGADMCTAEKVAARKKADSWNGPLCEHQRLAAVCALCRGATQ